MYWTRGVTICCCLEEMFSATLAYKQTSSTPDLSFSPTDSRSITIVISQFTSNKEDKFLACATWPLITVGGNYNLTIKIIIIIIIIIIGTRDSSVGIATGYGLDDQGVGSSSPCKGKNFLFSTSSRPALGSTQPPIQWVPGVKQPGREADQPVPRSRIRGSLHPFPHTSPWRSVS
jgi:hypothetical protein